MTKNISTVLHKIGDELIISVNEPSLLHERVYDLSGTRLGKVTRILGPVKNPFAVVKISGSRKEAFEGIEKVEIRS